MILGAHISTAGGVDKAPARSEPLGITAIQIFTKNQRQWVAKPLPDDEIQAWHKEVKKYNITHAISHDSYLINLCAPDPEKLEKSLNSMTDELERAEALGLSHVVAHPGSHLKEGEEWGVEKIAESISELHRRLPGYKAKIALENTAGQGTNLGYSFEQLAKMIELSQENDRLAICFDTCHAFSAGYDIHTEEAYEKTWSEFDRIIGRDRLAAIHLNDTKKPLGSRVDRHEQIGDGLLGEETFRMLMNDERLLKIPAFLETPGGEERYAVDLDYLRSLQG